MKRAAILILATVSLAAFHTPGGAAAGHVERSQRRDSPRCVLARQILADWMSRPGDNLIVEDTAARHDLTAQDPSTLLKAWAAKGQSNMLIDCPQLREEVTPPHRLATDEDRAAVQALPWKGFRTVTAFTTPFLDPSGTEAVVQVSIACPGLCGSGAIQIYKRRGRSWTLSQTIGSWIS